MSPSESVLDKVSANLPALEYAFQINKACVSVGFDWDHQADRFAKVEEEIKEIRAEIESGNRENLELEIGDLLLALVTVIAAEGFNPEEALQKACKKFSKRFRKVEELAGEMQRPISSFTLKELVGLWQRAKIST